MLNHKILFFLTAAAFTSGLKAQEPAASLLEKDSVFLQQLQSASQSALDATAQMVDASLNQLKKGKISLPGLGKVDPAALKRLEKFSFDAASVGSEANGWDVGTYNSVFLQNMITSTVSVKAIPLELQLYDSYNFDEYGRKHRISYKLNYARPAFLDKLKLNKADLRMQMRDRLSFANQIDYRNLMQQAYASVPSINELLGQAGCSLSELQEMSMEAFENKFGPDALKQKLTEAETLQKYYADYRKDHESVDSVILERLNRVDSQVSQLKDMAEVYKKLYSLKRSVHGAIQKIKMIQQVYEEKLGRAIEGFDMIRQVAGQNDFNGLQQLMTKVKGFSMGQHSLSTGTLVLRNYLQNGFSFEYEAGRIYCLLTRGTQERIRYSNGFFQNVSSGGLTEYYRYSGRYRLTGLSLRRGSPEVSTQQLSWMHFETVAAGEEPVALQRSIDVFTIGNSFNLPGRKLSYDLSTSMVRFRNTPAAGNGSFPNALAVALKYERTNQETGERQQVSLLYNSLLYFNPGLNGGLSRPGLSFIHDLNKRFDKTVRVRNRASAYSLRYGNSVSLKSFRDRLDVSYKLKKIRIGMLANAGYEVQSRQDPKSSLESHSLDVLGTIQLNRRLHALYFNISSGFGYGFNRQEQFSISRDYSYFTNARITLRQLSLDLNIDKFNTRNTEIFLVDSAALMYSSTFTMDAAFGYTSKKGGLVQFGLQYKVLNSDARQLFIAGSCEWTIARRLVIGGNVNLPLLSPVPVSMVNNSFNSKLIYNITGHDQ